MKNIHLTPRGRFVRDTIIVVTSALLFFPGMSLIILTLRAAGA